ncbi:molecular chaperone [Collimonas sp. NPDC087041]|uniref:fimbrial biogenesis chaperone n=1 Tax=Collimonas sp. NPDC087041 TaxID=3363960 RepID=UPI00380ACDE2
MKFAYLFVAAACLAGLFSAPTQAAVVLSSTRAIYPVKEREITVKLTNDDQSQPRVIQAWVDDDDWQGTPDKIEVPFTVTPPVFRMEAGKSQALRIVYTRENYKGRPLANDKESVFWLNVLAVPPTVTSTENTLQFAFRTRIKLFFRPENLAGKPEDAVSALQWRWRADAAKPTLEVRNPSAYHVSFGSIALTAEGQEIHSDDTPMLGPGGVQEIAFKGLRKTLAAGANIRFTTVNDYGSVEEHTAVIQP